MAQAPRLSDLKRKFFRANTTGVTASTPAGQLERAYYTQYIIANEAGAVASQVQKQPFDELEIRWLKAWIVKNLGTPPTNSYLSSHWAAAVRVLGKTAQKRTSDNMMTFFLNTTS